uniref:Pre-mRNA-splicing factor 38A n=1 Tax=Siphoviridae sp. ctzO58 TaxID=2825748 RepID=A0A8S5UWR4_9CAUD|nr:MAG TPA: Pre-mRNA-splicing factor 38A [Siphoviridae sp. ctzO58]
MIIWPESCSIIFFVLHLHLQKYYHYLCTD